MLFRSDGKFYGALTLRDLLITKKDEDLDEKIILSYPFVYDKEKITDAAIDTLADYSEDSIPVLDKETNEILGVITSADIVELINEEEEELQEEEKQKVSEAEKGFDTLEVIAAVLLLLVAVNRLFGVLPSTSYIEALLILAALALAVCSRLKLRKQ